MLMVLILFTGKIQEAMTQILPKSKDNLHVIVWRVEFQEAKNVRKKKKLRPATLLNYAES